MSVENFASRVSGLVRTKYGGNVLEAAHDIGIPYATLTRVMKEPDRSPRADTLQRIAQRCGVTVDYLLTGQASAADRAWLAFDVESSDLPFADLMQWADLVDSLALDAQTRAAVFDLPFHVRGAGLALVGAAITRGGGEARWRDSYKEAQRLEVRAWTTLLRGWIDAEGCGSVAGEIRARLAEVALGFSAVPIRMAATGKLTVEDILSAVDGRPVDGESLVSHVRRLLAGSRAHAAFASADADGDAETMNEVADPPTLDQHRKRALTERRPGKRGAKPTRQRGR